MEWYDAERFTPTKPGVYLCKWALLEDPKGYWMADGTYYNYWTGRKWVTGSYDKEGALRLVPTGMPAANTYINERCLRLVRWAFTEE